MIIMKANLDVKFLTVGVYLTFGHGLYIHMSYKTSIEHFYTCIYVRMHVRHMYVLKHTMP